MRTRSTPNEFILEDDTCKIICYDKLSKPSGYAIIDLEDIDTCKLYKWHISHYGYVIGSNGGKQVKMHRLLLKVSDSKMTDHKNDIKHDNRRSNLRICSCSENNKNLKKRKSNTSGYKGVFYIKSVDKWMAQIMKDYKGIYLGLFKNKDDAAKAYNNKATELFGEFAKLNIIRPRRPV